LQVVCHTFQGILYPSDRPIKCTVHISHSKHYKDKLQYQNLVLFNLSPE